MWSVFKSADAMLSGGSKAARVVKSNKKSSMTEDLRRFCEQEIECFKRITAVVLCVTLLSSQVVVANAEDSERMNVQTNSELQIYRNRMVSAVIHLKYLISRKVIFLILLKENQSKIQILVLK